MALPLPNIIDELSKYVRINWYITLFIVKLSLSPRTLVF